MGFQNFPDACFRNLGIFFGVLANHEIFDVRWVF